VVFHLAVLFRFYHLQWRSQEFDLGEYTILTSHCNFKTCVNVPHMNKTVTDFFWGYIYRYTPRRYAPDHLLVVLPHLLCVLDKDEG